MLAFHQTCTLGDRDGPWTEARSLPSERSCSLWGGCHSGEKTEKVLSLKTVPGSWPRLVASPLLEAFALPAPLPRTRWCAAHLAGQLRNFRGLGGSGILALVELTFIDSTICVCP